jgi:hypothetical protein
MQKEEMTEADLYRCWKKTRTVYKDLKECREVCIYAERCRSSNEKVKV